MNYNKEIISDLNNLFEFCMRQGDHEGAKFTLLQILKIIPYNILKDHCDVDDAINVRKGIENTLNSRKLITYHIYSGDKARTLSWGEPIIEYPYIERSYLNP